MTPLRAGAIALTLIIAVPIILGYGLASQDTEVSVDVTENTGSLSDIILNYETPYYVSYAGVNNNNALLQTTTSQVSQTALVTPGYNKSSETAYTYTPVYETATSTTTLNSTTTTTYSGNATTYGLGIDGIDNSLPTDLALGKLEYSVGGFPYFGLTYKVDSIYYTANILNGSDIYLVHNESGYRLFATTYDSGSTSDVTIDCDGFYLTVSGTDTLSLTYNTFYTIPDTFPDVWNTTTNGYLALKLTTSSGEEYHGFDDARNITVAYSNVTVVHGGETEIYAGVTKIEIAMELGNTGMTYYYQSETVDYYADVSYGWTLPSATVPYYNYWMNGFENGYIRIMLSMTSGERFIVTPSEYDTDYMLDIVSNNGNIVVTFDGDESHSLGSYTYLMIEADAHINYTTVTVTGLAGWPSISTYPDIVYNRISNDTTLYTGDFTQLYMSDIGSNTVDIRVDATEIVAGYFPSTKNYTLNLGTMYPEASRQSVIVDSVGVYGDSLTIGDTQYVVSDNKIAVNDVAIAVKDLVVNFTAAGDHYEITINGQEAADSENASVVFGGEWSLTLHRTETTSETVVQNTWVAGEFAFDENGFVMAMLLVAMAAFVGLGMTGGRSGAKVGILALICGGAVMVGLTII